MRERTRSRIQYGGRQMRRVNKVLFLPFYQCFADTVLRCDNVDQTEYGVAVSYRNNDSGSCNRHRQFCSGCANEHSQRVQDARTYQAGCANVVIDARTHAYCSPGLFLLTWINCNPSIASSLRYIHYKVRYIHYKVWHSRRSLSFSPHTL